MECRALKNDPVDHFSEGASVPRWGVTLRKHRAGTLFFSHKAVTVQGGYGALFAVRVQSFVSITRVAVQVWSEPENSHGTEA